MNGRDSLLAKGKEARGKKELTRHTKGEKNTLRQATLAKCYDCTCGYADGKVDCTLKLCPLYPWMPFRAGGPVKSGRVLSPEQRKIMGARLEKARNKGRSTPES